MAALCWGSQSTSASASDELEKLQLGVLSLKSRAAAYIENPSFGFDRQQRTFWEH